MGDMVLSSAGCPGGEWQTTPRPGEPSTGLDSSSFTGDFVDLGRSLIVVALYIICWCAHHVLIFLPQLPSLSGFCSGLEASLTHGKSGNCSPSAPPEAEVGGGGAIERALVQVLALVNDLPASSVKYMFARDLAEKIIQENRVHGQGYENVSRNALLAGFSRTRELLTRSLERIPQQHKGQPWWDMWTSLPVRAISMLSGIPEGGFRLSLPPSLALMRAPIGYLASFLLGKPTATTVTSSKGITSPIPVLGSSSAEEAEKLAQELLWLTKKLAETSALGEALGQWSSSASLASISLASSPRVQRALVQLSALFIKELAAKNTDFAAETKFRVLLLWLPLLCTATNGGDGPIFATFEKVDVERTLHNVIKTFPVPDQEIILGIWLREFALSSSDWPNLQPCYDEWCDYTRHQKH